ncbi:MAG TPA: DUF6677 family protein [Tepidisphaeraceae bacterium]|jgi:hypothetical protein|nr:DUF6677 family protein [Tepidisphaeraceae bacterium]
MADQPHSDSTASPALVALAAWVLPGAGYLLLKDYARGMTVGITIILLFFFGLLIGGIRCLEVPGYDPHGHKLFSWYVNGTLNGNSVPIAHTSTEPPSSTDGARQFGWTFYEHPVEELRSKPWNIPQFLFGPMDLLCDWWAVQVARPIDPEHPSKGYVAVRSHSRVNELGILYTAVAGLLNLLAIIDSSHRAIRTEAV